ncbi:MAG: hypothetical protein J5762_07685 [Clostridia bacterium]|nr:hypothetical protein [Clostridia bacterium]
MKRIVTFLICVFAFVLPVFAFNDVGDTNGTASKRLFADTSVTGETVKGGNYSDDDIGRIVKDYEPQIILLEQSKPTNTDRSAEFLYTFSQLEMASVSGLIYESFSDGKVTYVTNYRDNMSVARNAAFPYGTFSCKVCTVKDSDTGIVFALQGEGDSYFEGEGISYYFFFLNKEGYAYLGKTFDGKWNILKMVKYDFKIGTFYDLKVVYDSPRIKCYVDGNCVIGFKDNVPLEGTGFGIRSNGNLGAKFTDIYVSNLFLF